MTTDVSSNYEELIVSCLEKNGGKAGRQLLGDYVLNHFETFHLFSKPAFLRALKRVTKSGKIVANVNSSTFTLAVKSSKPKSVVKARPDVKKVKKMAKAEPIVTTSKATASKPMAKKAASKSKPVGRPKGVKAAAKPKATKKKEAKTGTRRTSKA